MNNIERHPHHKGQYIGYFPAFGSVRIVRGGKGWHTVNNVGRSDYTYKTARTLAELDKLIGVN
jgi:hypothetical protein